MLRKLYIHIQKNEIGSLTYTTQKYQLKIDKYLKERLETVKILEEYIGGKHLDFDFGDDFLFFI